MPKQQASASDVLIRIYGDSLSLPRAFDGIGYAQTYAELVRRQLGDRLAPSNVGLYNRSSGGDSIDGLYARYLHDCSYFGPNSNQLLVIQCGIVDCAPRPVPRGVRWLISRLPGPLRVPIVRLIHRARPYLLSAGISWRFTSGRRFSSVLSRWLAHAIEQGAHVYVVNIAPTVPAVDDHSPGFAESIIEYNDRIARAVATARSSSLHLIDVYGAITDSGDLARYVNNADGHHITGEGHELYARLILQHVLSSFGNAPVRIASLGQA